MQTGKEQIGILADLLVQKGVKQVVVSPGSRNAPAIIIFGKRPQLELISIGDERSAGFYALGIAMMSGLPVALLCTSGTAVLNYAPALAEAYYQQVPLLVITADRPIEWIDQGDGQTIRQQSVFSNYIRKSYQLPAEAPSDAGKHYTVRMINEAIDRSCFPVKGPVHINMPVAEPLYTFGDELNPKKERVIDLADTRVQISDSAMELLVKHWNSAASKMIIAGQLPHNHQLLTSLVKIANDPSVVVLTETTSNLKNVTFIQCIDRVIDGFDASEIPDFKPDLLITIGGAVVSKKIKALLRKYKPGSHWHVSGDTTEFYMDTYQSLTLALPVETGSFLGQLASLAIPLKSDFQQKWLLRSRYRSDRHQKYLKEIAYSDMLVYSVLFDSIPAGTVLHLANSTPVRYAQLFDHTIEHHFFSNRGTSGIDGCISTAAGAAHVSEVPVTVITGDIGFFYDSNALWNATLNNRLRIVLVNNGGGNIFRILDGPSAHAELEPYIETTHQLNASGLAATFGLRYYSAADLNTLKSKIDDFFNYSKPGAALFEITTPGPYSAEVLRNYFNFLNNDK